MTPGFVADQTMSADLVVIGAGASSTAAAWAAAEKGLKVVTLEKKAIPGGTGAFSEGIFAVKSKLQKDWNYGHWRGNARMVRAFVDRSADRITIRGAKATVIATCGFFDNKEMREKYLRFPNADGLAQTGKTGDGIRMAWSVGAGKEGTEVQASYRPDPHGVGTTNHVSATAKQPHLWLTPKGERFCNEIIMLEWPFAGNVLERIGGTMYVVYDQKTLDHMVKEEGIDLGVGVMVPVGTKLANFSKEWDAAVKAGWAFKADTLDGLAKATGMNPEKLKKTVADYNGYCAVRHDAEFAKDPKYLREVKTGPFYAIKSVASTLGTLGGIKANERFEVVTKNEDPIPGLYAAGNDVGGMYGDSYDLLMAGSTVGFAVNSARIAVGSAAEYIKTVK